MTLAEKIKNIALPIIAAGFLAGAISDIKKCANYNSQINNYPGIKREYIGSGYSIITNRNELSSSENAHIEELEEASFKYAMRGAGLMWNLSLTTLAYWGLSRKNNLAKWQ